jgi:ligand-binding sensor domain-containing protein/AraC-like DNA-binding protein
MCIFAAMNKSLTALSKISMAIAMLFITIALHAQRFVNTTLDGAQAVYAITQDTSGVVWLGTDNGLYSYDGYHDYRHFASHTFSHIRINALGFEGSMLYLATGNGMLKFDTQKGIYASAPAMESDGGKGSKKVARELRVLNMKGRKDAFGNDVYAILHTQKGLLVGSLAGLRLNQRQILLTPGAQPLVNALAYDAKRHCYWIGTEGALYCADQALQNFSKIAALDGNSVKCLDEDQDGNLYIGTDNGLYRMAMNNSLEHFVHDSRNEATIPNNIVWSCYVDKWQNVWIGTDHGLSRLSTHTYYRFTSLDKITFSGEGNCLHAILQTRSGDWWMGGTNGLIHYAEGVRVQGTASEYQNVVWYKQNNPSAPLAHNRVRKIYEDKEGDVWICTDHGINLYQKSTGKLLNFIVYDKTGKYSTAWAYDILQDQKGRMWMASYQGGVFVLDKQRLLAAISLSSAATATCVADYHFSDKGKNALSGLHIGQLVLDGKGFVWASSYNRLDRIDTRTLRISHIPGNDAINYLMKSDNGNVWVGYNASVKCFMVNLPMKGKELESKEWKIDAKVVSMCDVENKVWVVAGNVCSVLDPENNSFRFFIPMESPNNIYYSKLNHEVVMGGNDGFISIRADLSMPKDDKAQLLLAGIVVNGRQTQDALLDENIEGTPGVSPVGLKTLVLKHDENNFTLQLSDLPFADHPTAVYAYRLEGSDHEWHYLDKGDLDITYNGLSYGDYHLTVHMVDGEGNIGDEVYQLEISVLPPWYLTIWCKLFYLTLLIVCIVWVINAHFVRKQLKEAKKQKEEILEQVQARMQFYANLADELKNAAAHRSFDEVNHLVVSNLDVNASDSESESAMIVDLHAPQAPEVEMDELDKKLLDEIKETIEENMVDSDFNVSVLQEKMGMGNKQLYRKLKAITGQTPVEYIRDMRMQKAAKLLKAGKFSVSEVMYTVGFSNSSYFSKCFSKAFGMTPTEFMRS